MGENSIYKKYSKSIKKLTLSAMFLSLALVLPLLTGQIKEIGNMLLPMHVPVLLCGLICGMKYGFSIGLIAPFLRFAIFGMPPMPNAISMAFELAAYGFFVGLFYMLSKRKNLISLYISMIASMLLGRIIWGIAQIFVLGLNGKSFTWKLFVSGAFLNAFPGIILQLILIPAVMIALDKAGFVKFESRKKGSIC